MFAIIMGFGLRFTMKADSRAEACQKLMQMLGKSNLPWYVRIEPA